MSEETGALQVTRHLITVAIYCLIGLSVDYWLYVATGAMTAWANPITYLVMVFWPAFLIWEFLVIMFWIVIVCLVIFGICALISNSR